MPLAAMLAPKSSQATTSRDHGRFPGHIDPESTRDLEILSELQLGFAVLRTSNFHGAGWRTSTSSRLARSDLASFVYASAQSSGNVLA